MLFSLSRVGVRHCLAASRTVFRTYATPAKDIEQLVNANKIVIFMKGNPEAPRCGFSNAVVQMLRMHGVQYDSYDVLEDDDLRQGIKDYSSWPTIPQVYINGNFVGGCDIMLQMHKNGELIEELEKCGIKSALIDDPQDSADDKNKSS